MRQVSSASPSVRSASSAWSAACPSSSPSISAEICCFMPLPPLVFTGPQQWPQLLRDRLARPEDPRAHRADRAIHGLRDVLVAHAFDLAHLNRLSQLLGQPLDRRVHRLRDLVRQQHALRRVDVAQLLAFFESFRLFGLSLGRGRRPPTHGHEIVFGRINSNAVQPRIKGAVATECGERAVSLDERFLRHILDLGRVADEARQQASKLALVLLYKQLESSLVATLSPRDQFAVYIALRHRVTRAPYPVVCNAYVP